MSYQAARFATSRRRPMSASLRADLGRIDQRVFLRAERQPIRGGDAPLRLSLAAALGFAATAAGQPAGWAGWEALRRLPLSTNPAPVGGHLCRRAAPSWDRSGVEALFFGPDYAALIETLRAEGARKPSRAFSGEPWSGWPHEGRIVECEPSVTPDGHEFRRVRECKPGTAASMVQDAARGAGWIRAAAPSRWLRRLLGKAPNGGFWLISARYSPGAAERRGRAIQARANEVLRPFGARVAWHAVAQALATGPKRTGKAAVFAAALTLGWSADSYWGGGYHGARAALARVSRTASSRNDATDGVDGFATGEPDRAGHDCTTQTIVTAGRYRNGGHRHPVMRAVTVLVRHIRTGRTYHGRPWQDATSAVRDAREAWSRQRIADATERARQGAHDSALSSVTVLVRRADSYRAGNCRPGTEEFADRHGWGSRWYVPSQWLRATDDHFAIRAAALAEAEVLRLMAA